MLTSLSPRGGSEALRRAMRRVSGVHARELLRWIDVDRVVRMWDLAILRVNPGALRFWAGFTLCAVLLGCGPTLRHEAPKAPSQGLVPGTGSAVGVDSDDLSSGRPDAVVTLVAFLDLECPFCARVHPTIQGLRAAYAESELRIVIKHAPLVFHARAVPAAVLVQAVFEQQGAASAFDFIECAFRPPRDLSDKALQICASEVGMEAARFESANTDEGLFAKVERDQQQAARLGVSGVPAFFVNGARLTGARPLSEFKHIIEHELAAGVELAQSGTAPAEIYAKRVAVNLRAPEQLDLDNDSMRFVVNVGASPATGTENAPVTIVEFADFECVYCARAHETMKALMAEFPGEIRWVMKHNPLSLHPQAMNAAQFALEVYRQRGAVAYWAALDELYELPRIEASSLEELATEFEVNRAKWRESSKQGKAYGQVIADQDQAMDLVAEGTPHFFVNGRRLAGAKPLEHFQRIVREELLVARALVSSGTEPRGVYAALQSQAFSPPALNRVPTPESGSDLPSLGPGSAPVVVQVFSDFECAYCRRVMPTLRRLRQRYPSDVRIVWRHLPLAFHPNARLAAAATTEAYVQGGNRGFWAMANSLFAQEAELTPDVLTQGAAKLGLDVERFQEALKDGRHEGRIQADERAARMASLRGTPSIVINGYALFGAQPMRRFERLVRLALEEAGRAPERTASP